MKAAMEPATWDHLVNWAETGMFDEEREEFLVYMAKLDADDVAYYCDRGWPSARDYWRDYVWLR